MVNPIRHWLVGVLYASVLLAPSAHNGEAGRPFIARVFAQPDHLAIPGAAVLVRETGQRSIADSAGDCVLQFPDGVYTLLIHRIGFRDVEVRVDRTSQAPDSLCILMQPSPFQTGEVLARSTRTDGPTGSTPFPVEIQQRDRIAALRPVSLPEIVSMMPGVALTRDGSWETAISIRGLKQSHIVSLIDGVRIETATDIAGALSLINLNDIDRIETVKTSGSVLYGTGAVGGIVAIATKQPAFSEHGEIHAESVSEASSVDDGFSQYLAVEGASGLLAGRVSGGFRRAGNTRTPSGILNNSQFEDFTLSGSLLLRTIGHQSLALSFQRAQAENAGIPGGAPFAMTATATYTLARRQCFSAEYRIPNPETGVGLISILASHQEIDRNVSVVQSPVLTLTPHAIHVTNSAGVTATVSPWESDILAVGVDVWQRSLESRREKRNASTMTITGEQPVPDSKFLSAGVFAQNEWRLGQMPLTLVAGARYDGIQVTNADSWNPEYVVSMVDGSSIAAAPQRLWTASLVKNSSWSLNGGVRTDVSPEWSVALLLGTAYRAPTLEERFQYIDLGSVVLVGDPGLHPERSLALNLGARLQTEKVRMRTDVFLTRLDDLVSTLPGTFDGRPALVNANIGSAMMFGGETFIDIAFTDRSGLQAWVSYVRGRDTRAHANLTQIPPVLARLECRESISAAGTFIVSLDCAATQAYPGPGEVRIPGHARVDIEFSTEPVRLGGISFVLRSGVTNLLDKDYREFLSTLRGIVRSEAGRNFFLFLQTAV